MFRAPLSWLLTPLCLVALALACDDAAAPPPGYELYIDGTLAPAQPNIAFPPTAPGAAGVAVQIEIKNLGPSALELTGTPAVRLERDDRLAFRVSQPATTTYARGESVVINVVFAPYSPGSSVARIVIATNAGEEPIVIGLNGEGVVGELPTLGLTFDGAPIADSYDFGAVAALETESAILRLTNSGTGTLELGAAPVRLGGSDAAAFSYGVASDASLAAGESADITISFSPESCRTFRAVLTIAPSGAGTSIDIELSGRGGENPQGHAGVTDAELVDAPDLDVALSAQSVGGKRRFAVGNLTVGSYAGHVKVYSWDGCSLGAGATVSAASAGLDAQLFGAQVALTDDGTTMLVTARDQTKDAWLFSIGVDDVPRFLGTLATFDEGAGHGRGAALAGDGSVAFIGQTMADSGFNAHGAVFVYERPATGWQAAPEALARLGPSSPTQVELIGSSLDASRNGDVVVSGSLLTPVGASQKGPATAYVWQAARDEAGTRTWGKPIPLGEPNQRIETVRLISAQVPSDAAARVGVSADGNTIAMSAVVNTEVQIRIYTRVGSELWGIPTSSIDERLPNARLTMTASAGLRFTLAPMGELLIVADQSGARQISKPPAGWADATLSTFDQTWNVPFYSALAMAPDGLVFAGMDKAGAAWFVFR